MSRRVTLALAIWKAAMDPAGGLTTGAELMKLGSDMMMN